MSDNKIVVMSLPVYCAYFFFRYFIGGMFLLYGFSSAISIVLYVFMTITGQLPFSALLYNLVIKIGCVLLYGGIGYLCYKPVFLRYGLFKRWVK